MGTERSSKVIFVYEYLLPCSKYRGRFMVRFKVLFQSFKFRIRFVFGGGLAHSHFVFIIIYFLKYFNCLKENINLTLCNNNTNICIKIVQMICKLYAFYLNCMVLSVHLHVLCNLPAVIVYVCQLLN